VRTEDERGDPSQSTLSYDRLRKLDRSRVTSKGSESNYVAILHDFTSENVSGDTLFKQSVFKQPAELNINFYSDNTSKFIARDTEVKYSLRKLATGLQNASVVFYSASENLFVGFWPIAE